MDCWAEGEAVPRVMNKDLILAAWSLDLLRSEELPEAAMILMESGFDSPSLRVMAGQQRPTIREVGTLFDDCLTELDLELPAREVAAICLGQFYAGEIVSGRMEAFSGAGKLFELSCRVELEALSPFRWPDTEGEIIESSRRLLLLPAI